MREWRDAEIESAFGLKAFRQRDESPARGVSTDSRTLQPGNMFISLVGENFDGHDYIEDVVSRGARTIVAASAHQSRFVHLADKGGASFFFVPDTLVALGNLGAHARSTLNCPVLGIAGSNGKTSTKDMAVSAASQILSDVHGTRGNLNNHIGLPLTLANIPTNARLAILEMGMNHAGELSDLSKIARPDHAIVTSIAQEHAEFFSSIEEIAEAELEIVDGMGKGGTLLFHAGSPCQENANRAAKRSQLRLQSYQAEKPEISSAGLTCSFAGNIIVNPYYFSTVMAENLTGALWLLAAGGLSIRDLVKVASGVKPQAPRRFQVFRRIFEKCEIILVDDSYNANQASFEAAIRSLRAILPEGRLALFAGEMAELGTTGRDAHRSVGETAGDCGFTAVFASGTIDAEILLDGYRARFKEGRTILRKDALALLDGFLLEDFDGILIKGSRRARMDLVSDEIKKMGFAG